MIIKRCKGYELEKQQSNTSEDFFNRSEVTFMENGTEKTVHILYVRYFNEHFDRFTPYQQDPIFSFGVHEVSFKDIVALACLLKNPAYKHRKRVYINSEREFQDIFKGLDFHKLSGLVERIVDNGSAEVRSSHEYIIQTV
ncbi:hypothetical protein [Mesobacillus foraminis]|uniref:hypothetical protein n=1 Tax=Mesobacillus foraminis TaxID=279826 RepID=UPI000EF4B7BE|nr:hypothetical protein [Mesobacillus foraminis]